MSTTTDFISELVRAANQLDGLTDLEQRRLLRQAVSTIGELRQQIGIPGIGTPKDAVLALQTSAAAIGLSTRTEDQVRAVLLDAAGMIRDLYIVLDSETEIQITGDK